MIALIAGFFLVVYLLAPGAIYRLAFSFQIPNKRFQRTRTEEVVFSVLATLVPFACTCMVLFYTRLGHFPSPADHASKSAAYGVLFSSIILPSQSSSDILASAYLRALLEQVRFGIWLWLFCGIEGWLAGRVVARYGDYPSESLLRWVCDKLLLKHVSEWQVLFTTLPLRSTDPRRVVEVDALSTLDVLYRGRLANWFTDQDGKLAGLFLSSAARYQREDLVKDRESGIDKTVEAYWKDIPGANLYLAANSIANYNIRYVEPTRREIVEEVLGGDVVITELPPDSNPPAPATPPPHPSQRQ